MRLFIALILSLDPSANAIVFFLILWKLLDP